MGIDISEAFSSFSKKLKRFEQSSSQERTVTPARDALLQTQIRESGERFKIGVVSTYRIFRAPFEALGQNSDRAASIDRDQQALLKAYNLYKSVIDIDRENQDEENSTHIGSVQIVSPLAQKASYTDGGQFIYLEAWLYFEQNCREYIPVFMEVEGKNQLVFKAAGSFDFNPHDKEIFRLIEAEFYS